ncbi:hypothetical protein EVAR_56096_1 [Eumeta japonica]|uniref:Uncharacterized protein n=1 Tax=Eumeta variegata TaxID=151549 RepID=A0A4C1YH23_EUMVA|nr:hypothetical protein EVAR_56096_1 [Eumeta japonica]
MACATHPLCTMRTAQINHADERVGMPLDGPQAMTANPRTPRRVKVPTPIFYGAKLGRPLCAAACMLLALSSAEKKIELQDIEEDNLRSEKEKDEDVAQPRAQSAAIAKEFLPLEFLKNGIIRNFENPQLSQQQYVQQYDVTETPEERPTSQPQYNLPTAQAKQGTIGYLSNLPMQIYFVPQYFEAAQQAPQSRIKYTHVDTGSYQTAPESVQSQNNYVEVPAYVTPTGKAFIPELPQYTFVYTPQPTVSPGNVHVSAVVPSPPPLLTGPQASPAPVKGYNYPVPVIQYQPSAPSNPSQNYYPDYVHYTETNPVHEVSGNEIGSPKYSTQSEISYTKGSASEFPRYYNSRAPIRENPRHHGVPELPPPSPLLLRPQPSHLAGTPKILPMFRPFTKPMYSHIQSSILQGAVSPRPYDINPVSFNKRPTSLLDSYIPSSVQVEYLRRGLVKEPLATYDLLASGRHSHFPQVNPRQLERGFLPNQVFHTAAGGVTYGHYKKRTPKSNK